MAEEWAVTEVQLVRQTIPRGHGKVIERDVWHVRMTRPGGRDHVHMFPADTLAWRAAEYGIDPADKAQLLDIVLHEPHIPAAETATRPAERVVIRATADGVEETAQTLKARAEEPVTLWNAPDIPAARTAHLERIARAKERVRVGPAKAPPGAARLAKERADPLDVIRQRTVINPQDVEARQRMVHQARERARQPPTPMQAVRLPSR